MVLKTQNFELKHLTYAQVVFIRLLLPNPCPEPLGQIRYGFDAIQIVLSST